MSSSPSEMMDEVNLNGAGSGGNSSSDDEVVVGEDEDLTESKDAFSGASSTGANGLMGSSPMDYGEVNSQGKGNASNDLGFFQFDNSGSNDIFGDRPMPDWVGWREPSDVQVVGPSTNPFVDYESSDPGLANQSEEMKTVVTSPSGSESSLPNGTSASSSSSEGSVASESNQKPTAVPSLFEEDVEFVGVELEGTEKAMEQALKEGIVGEAGPLKKNISPKAQEKENPDDSAGMKEFNDANYWRVDQEVAVLE